MLKLLIWLLTIVGLLPAVLVLTAGVAAVHWQRQVATMPAQPGDVTPLSYQHESWLHDSWIRLGSLKASIYPRLWATVVLGTGMVLVLVGLFWQLHVR